jgi:hypothetical protein
MNDFHTRTSCEVFGHTYQFDNDDEVFDSCLDCGEEREPED